ncbi:efflux RND transporter permease subunit [Hyphomicrobium sp.]|uniref:efflux RND transporter permease subunit n=1 Tax=Hyphomicrobium sp. TaxID=82 RepID=UPI003F71122A
MNQGRLFISLKPLSERLFATALVIDRLRTGARQGKAKYQYTIWSLDLGDLTQWLPKIMTAVRQIPDIVDVGTDREQGGLQLNVTVDRQAASRLGGQMSDIDAALANAISQRLACRSSKNLASGGRRGAILVVARSVAKDTLRSQRVEPDPCFSGTRQRSH